MFFVYILQAINYPKLIYVGYSTDLDRRLETHNSGGSIYTAKHRPWKFKAHFAFEYEQTAKDFESYLKSSSGKAFMLKRLIKLSIDRSAI